MGGCYLMRQLFKLIKLNLIAVVSTLMLTTCGREVRPQNAEEGMPSVTDTAEDLGTKEQTAETNFTVLAPIEREATEQQTIEATGPQAAEKTAFLPQREESLTAVLDRDGSDGYQGDFVLIYNPEENASTKSTGDLNDLLAVSGKEIPVREGTYLNVTPDLYKEPDPYITEEIRQEDLLYDFEGEDPWGLGFRKVFRLLVSEAGTYEMLMKVTAVGEYCRIWSPVNPAFGAIERINKDWPKQLALAMDEQIPVLERYLGTFPDLRGDGKINILCYDRNMPSVYGDTSLAEFYEEVRINGIPVKGNRLAAVSINTAPLLQGEYEDVSDLYTNTVHEITHSIFLGKNYPQTDLVVTADDKAFGEFLAVSGQEMVSAGSTLFTFLPHWYADQTVWEDLAEDNAEAYYRNKESKRQNGQEIIDFYGDREDYASYVLLSHFLENRCGVDIFRKLMEQWDYQKNVKVNYMVDLIWKEMGYDDYSVFLEEFLLSILLHEDSGRYQLHPFAGYDQAQWDGVKNPFSYLVPIVTEKTVHLHKGAYTVIQPKEGVYYPPQNASPGLRYVGISMKNTE